MKKENNSLSLTLIKRQQGSKTDRQTDRQENKLTTRLRNNLCVLTFVGRRKTRYLPQQGYRETHKSLIYET